MALMDMLSVYIFNLSIVFQAFIESPTKDLVDLKNLNKPTS